MTNKKLDSETTRRLINDRRRLTKRINKEMRTGNYDIDNVLMLLKLESYYTGLINQYLDGHK